MDVKKVVTKPKHPLLDLGQDNKKHGGLRDPHCLGYRRGSQFWRSFYKMYKTDELISIQFLSGNTYLERNMIIANPNFELLLPNDILFRPIRIVFPGKKSWISGQVFSIQAYLVISLASTIRLSSFITRGPIHTVDIRTEIINDVSEGEKKTMLTFFTDQTVVSVVGIICVTETTMGKLEFEELVAMLAWVSSAARNSYQ